MKVHLDTPSSVPNRTSCTLVPFTQESIPEAPLTNGEDTEAEPAAKRAKVDGNNSASSVPPPPQDLMVEVENFASILSTTLDLES
jgi:hypothetical protein